MIRSGVLMVISEPGNNSGAKAGDAYSGEGANSAAEAEDAYSGEGANSAAEAEEQEFSACEAEEEAGEEKQRSMSMSMVRS
jgi:hypothetical protein